MFRLILLFLFSSILISQENVNYDSYFQGIELGNIGGPFLSYYPNFQSINLEIKSDFMDTRLVEYYNNYRLFDKIFFLNTDITNNITYITN